MSTSKKPLRKRKRQSPPPPPSTTSKINRRLEKLRSGQRNLWDGDDDDDEAVEDVQPKTTTTSDNTYIVLNDSDDEKTSSRKRSRSNKSRKKLSRINDENLSSDNDCNIPSKCATCLICSILTTLSSYNCCSKHLSVLLNHKNSHQKQTTDTEQWPPQQVMIVPMTDELIQRYLNPQEIYRLRRRTSTSPTPKKPTESKISTRKLSKKSTMTSEPSDTEHTNITKLKSSTKSSHHEPEQISSSSLISDSSLPNSGVIPVDTTFTVVTSTSTTINSFESPNVLDTCQLQQSSADQPIVIDDSQPENLSTNKTHEKKQTDPWTPISDETYAAIEIVLDQTPEEQTEFTPATARRTPTDLMASCLPKIQLKKGRFRHGKPIADKNTSDTTTNECRSMTISQSSSTTSTSTSVIITNTRPPPSLATIMEDESLVIQSTRQISEKSSQILSERHENSTEELSDTVMSCLFAQDESSQHDHIHTTTKKIVSKDALPPPAIIIEDYSHEHDMNQSMDISQSSQLTNDQNDTQPLISSTTNEKITTPARISYLTNPDGSRISISRPPLSTNHQSPLTSLRRTSTDVNPITSHTNK